LNEDRKGEKNPAVVAVSDSLPQVPPKSDPNYFKIIGQISAAKRKQTSEDFAAMANKRKVFRGGRKRKNGIESEMA
jgi:hypothetical protein